MDIIELSAHEIREKIGKKELKAVEVVEAFLNNIKTKDEDLNAFITINEDALEDARRIDDRIAKGEKVGKLAGIPISIKDNISTKDLRTTAGSKMLENYIPPFDARLIEKIREEDGIIIGKTNLDEFAMGDSSNNSYFGGTKNPIDESKCAGGSSSGSAASVKGNEAVLSVGTDTGGSIRQPASFCDLVGVKPTYGSVSRYGVISMAGSMDQAGPLAKNIKDAAMLLGVIMDYDEKDSTSYEGAKDILKDIEFNEEGFKDKKIAIIKEVVEIDMEDGIKDRFDEAVEIIEKLGGEVDTISLDYIKYSASCYNVLSAAEVSSNLARYDGVRYGHRAKDYEDLDELYINSRTEGLGRTVKKRIIQGLHFTSTENREDYYVRSLKIRRLIKEEIDGVFEEYDLIIIPSIGILPFGEGDKPKIKGLSTDDIFTMPANLSGNPAMSVPMGEVKGLPIGLQIVGRHYGEKEMLEAAYSFEGGFNNGL